MPPRKTLKQKSGSVRRNARRPARVVKTAPQELTYKDLQALLQNVRKWWVQLDRDVARMEELLETVKAGQPVPSRVADGFRRLLKTIKGQRICVFPPGPKYSLPVILGPVIVGPGVVGPEIEPEGGPSLVSGQ